MVVLSHTKPDHWVDRSSEPLMRLVGSRPLLVLHGHDHPRLRRAPEWEADFRFAGQHGVRLKVYSAAAGLRGIGAIIQWNGSEFLSPDYR